MTAPSDDMKHVHLMLKDPQVQRGHVENIEQINPPSALGVLTGDLHITACGHKMQSECWLCLTVQSKTD